MPTKKKTGKGEGRSTRSSAGQGEAKAAPVGANQAKAGTNTRVTTASENESTTSAAKRTRRAKAGKPQAKRAATPQTSTGASPSQEPPLSLALPAAPTREQIASRAYELFTSSGYQDGHSLDHWLQAERELRSEYEAKK